MRATKPPGGIFQRVRPHGVWYARRVVPTELRRIGSLGRELVRSLGTNDRQLALHLSRDILAEFDATITAACNAGAARHWTLQEVLDLLGDWRDAELTACMGNANYADFEVGVGPCSVEIGFNSERSDLSRALAEARAYFQQEPTASREIAVPAATAVLICRLESVAKEPSRWVELLEIDQALDDAFADVTMLEAASERSTFDEPTQTHHIPANDPNDAARLPEWARERARQAFIPIYLEVTRFREWERSRHAAVLTAANAVASAPGLVTLATAPAPYFARPDDKTFGQLVKAFLSSRATKAHRYKGIIAALEEVVGQDRIVRAITKADVKAALAFVRRIPKNAKKFWPHLSLAQAVEKADAEGREERLATGSVSTYFSHLCSIFAYAIAEDWLEVSPCADIKVESEQTTDRRAFDSEELNLLFRDFAESRAAEPAKFWVPALALYTGARQNELCQLLTSDVQEEGGVVVLHLTKYDDDGVDRGSKKLKTKSSARFVPLHSEVIRAGFRTYVQERRAAGDERLFSQLTRHETGYGHYFGKWFGRRLRKLGITDKSATFHGFRHGWREASGLAGMTDRQVDAMAGWASTSQAGKYGRRTIVKELAPIVEKIDFGDFRLPD